MPQSAVKPQEYSELLAGKVKLVSGLLAPFSPPEPRVFASAPIGFRMRAEFRMWHEGDDLNYVMFRPEDRKTPVPVTQFTIANESIQQLMPVLRDKLKNNDLLRRKLFQVEFLSTLAGDMLVTLVYHRKLDEEWEQAARNLVATLEPDFGELSLIGRSRKQKVVLHSDYVREVLSVAGRDFHYLQYEQAFSQPNARVNIAMIEWACEQATTLKGDLLELYCGNGNFTLPLAQHFNNVIATELSKVSVRAARAGTEANGIENIQLVRLSAEEVTQAINGKRVFRRLADLPKPLAEYELRTLFVDPPRAGLDEYTEKMAASFDSVLYISCNPQTLAQNLQGLCRTHRIEQFALFDQFPYTDHMECGVLLKRIDSCS